MSTEPAPAHLNPDQLLAKLIEMEGVIERQKVALNALDDERSGLKSERDHFKSAFEEADAERQRLELVIRQLVRAQFGRKSERLDPAQFQLTLENLEQEIAAAKAPRQEAADSDANRRPRRAPARRNLGHLPAHLERYEVVIEPEDRNCPYCGGVLHQIGVEETERLDAVPLRLRVRVTRRPIYGCRGCAEAVVQAPAPDSAIPGGLPTEGLLAQVAVAKYNDGLPLYRQARILERDGIHLDRATLSDWMGRTAWWLKPLWELLLGSVLSSPKLFCDDTRLPVLAPGKGKTSTGYLLGPCPGRQPLAGRPAAGGGLCLHRGPGPCPRGAGRLHRRAPGRRLGRLQAPDRQTGRSPGRCQPRHPGLLLVARPAAVLRDPPGHPVADRRRGAPADRRAVPHRGRDPRSAARCPARCPSGQEQGQGRRAQGLPGRAAGARLRQNAGGQGDPLHAGPLGRAVRLPDRWPGRAGYQHHRAPASGRGNHPEERSVRRGGLRRPVLGDLHLADPERQDERP